MTATPSPVTVLLLHGWPGLSSDFAVVRDALPFAHVIAPDLSGFGRSFAGALRPEEASAESHARRVLALLDREGADGDVIVAGYDIGSRVAQAALRLAPERFAGAVLTPAYPGIGDRVAAPAHASKVWYQHFHREPIAARLIDGQPGAVRAYLTYIWESWSGPSASESHPDLEELVTAYSRPGAFAASIEWYRANRVYAADPAPIRTPVVMLWPQSDPLFPPEWADRVGEFFPHSEVRAVHSGHFVPIEAPSAYVAAIRALMEGTVTPT